MARKKITVTRETSTGLNTRFNVPGQGEITRGRLAEQVERGEHEGYHVRRVNGRRIVASNPDDSSRNNLG
ncbi:hypothetical protein BMI86_19810 [Thioclava sp. DLFJ5-1]|nr:hypothetical protein BMI86_19810 [Thioclava sp. DLFJ5-1]